MEYQQQLLPLLFSLQDKVVRDLAFSIFSPSIINDWPAGQLKRVLDDSFDKNLQSIWSWLRQLDQHPELLHQWIQARFSRRLGLYFENLLSFWFNANPNVTVIEEHLQIYKDKQTIGELDIVFEQDNTIIHWELAVKFYLKQLNQHDMTDYIGPGGRDRLDIKLNHFAKDQLPLVTSHEAQAVLPQQNIQSYAFMKGYLFHHIYEQDAPLASPISAHHCRGYWARFDEWQSMEIDGLARWLVIPRLEWLSPLMVAADKAASLMTFDGLNAWLFEHFSLHSSSQLVVRLLQNADNQWLETTRYFVVDEAWPNRQEAFSL